ncbi:coenzyme F420-0:L-glutamate ligase [Stetteria hydrogenophila]
MALRLEVIGLVLPEIRPGDDLARLIVEAASGQGVGVRDGDVIVVTSKALLKARGLMYRLSDVKPSLAARLIARLTGKDPREVELILSASRDILAVLPLKRLGGRVLPRLTRDPGEAARLLERIPSMLVVVTRQGLIALDGGVDYSNLPPGHAIADTVDFDAEAERLRFRIEELTGKRVAVVVSDTEANTSGKLGTVDVAVGSSGIKPVTPHFASRDIYGNPKFGGVDIVVDELASAAALLMGQTSERVPVVIVRGLRYERSSEGVKDYAINPAGITPTTILKTILARLIFKLLYRRNR